MGIAASAAAYAAENAGTRNWRWTGFGVAAAVGGLLGVPVAPEATAGRAVYHSGVGRIGKATPAGSSIWKKLKSYKGKFRTNGKSGKVRKYYKWDYTHGDIEVFVSRGKHLGSADPYTVIYISLE
ncbi:colicin E3/pyocin S6 family cytotoxin [Frankia sp. Cas4]|uniref:colicin E3/pyocin S6 family cytotoxin n=1 Tax=Frankia sp. Cas4 TaxID=3073927 RepID=UPI002AD2F04F|nr:colicin E3/pyocin S6 family cytotoxin [Frankia sp. Cas4]